jgi:hypothetical protein
MIWIDEEEYSKQLVWKEVKLEVVIYTLKSGVELFIENPSHISVDNKFIYFKNENSFHSILIEDVSACSSITKGEGK